MQARDAGARGAKPLGVYRLVTCPETAHLELIEYDDTPCGMVIQACSRYRPVCAIECSRTCAARLDRKRAEQAAREV